MHNKEIIQDIVIDKWILCKRFQRMQKAESSQGNNFEDSETQENIVSNIDKS